MRENTNKAILVNSLILYIRLGLVAITSLFTTRFALKALGVDDFGLFSVVGGIVSFMSIFNTVMLTTSNRFIATAIGKGNIENANKQFNINLIIHIAIAALTLLLTIPLGEWYINKFVNYPGDLNNAIWVYRISMLGAVISFLGVPYNGLLLAKERFFVFCSTDVLSSILKMAMSYFLISHFSEKLLVYALTIAFTTAYPTLVFYIYCNSKFAEICKFQIVKDKKSYRDVLDFSMWIGYGAVATVGKNQGAALIINGFFNTVMNTALGIANSINQILLSFSHNISKSIAPQIVKNYAIGNKDRCESLVILSSKASFIVMLLVSSPFIVAPDFIFKLWLGTIPDHLILFTYLLIADALIGSINAGIPELIFATGNIKWYQIIVNTLFLLSVIVGFFVLKAGAPAHYLQVTYIFFSIIILVVRQIVLNRVVKFNNKRLLISAYLPSITIFLGFIPILFLKNIISPLLLVTASIFYIILLGFLIGLSKNERRKVLTYVKTRFPLKRRA